MTGRVILALAILVPSEPAEPPIHEPIAAERLTVSVVEWDTRSVPNGWHVLTAVARDAAGNITESPPRLVYVNNPGPHGQSRMQREP